MLHIMFALVSVYLLIGLIGRKPTFMLLALAGSMACTVFAVALVYSFWKID